ncbi:hypothetical protein [Roseiconus lacunae]|uniref:Uncharacterized protein n=1 Tax=Roseiconus lacunae TaxID=2605694 RepID=A0ABT7PIG8_9BACT|nr:hypothetical protein [Roseiconus lacunae]MCD0458408.1 hypothetical protein [Roseiconus lacunae]MDM4016296.1 hypothetical protein [Roseiconus lacunae]WRQ52101.1 hypothetical protein U8335_06060 [Stieleria sp. HD01]
MSFSDTESLQTPDLVTSHPLSSTSSPSASVPNQKSGFVERRKQGGSRGAGERRQFGSSHEGLSEAGRELALAIDQYKMQHHRRYITCDEMLHVISQLGYRKDDVS